MVNGGVPIDGFRQIQGGTNLRLKLRRIVLVLGYAQAALVVRSGQMNGAEAGANPPTAANSPIAVGFRAVGMGALHVFVHERKNQVWRPLILGEEGSPGNNVRKVAEVARECVDVQREPRVDLNAIAPLKIVKYLSLGVGITLHLGYSKTAALRRECIQVDYEVRLLPAGLHDGPGGGYPDSLPLSRLPEELGAWLVLESRICVVLKLRSHCEPKGMGQGDLVLNKRAVKIVGAGE